MAEKKIFTKLQRKAKDGGIQVKEFRIEMAKKILKQYPEWSEVAPEEPKRGRPKKEKDDSQETE